MPPSRAKKSKTEANVGVGVAKSTRKNNSRVAAAANTKTNDNSTSGGSLRASTTKRAAAGRQNSQQQRRATTDQCPVITIEMEDDEESVERTEENYIANASGNVGHRQEDELIPDPELMCRRCHLVLAGALLLPCHHLTHCIDCADTLASCPTCCRQIERARLYTCDDPYIYQDNQPNQTNPTNQNTATPSKSSNTRSNHHDDNSTNATTRASGRLAGRGGRAAARNSSNLEDDETEVDRNSPTPELVAEAGEAEEEYEVDRVVDCRGYGETLEYRIVFRGWEDEHDWQWTSASDCDCYEVIELFKKRREAEIKSKVLMGNCACCDKEPKSYMDMSCGCSYLHECTRCHENKVGHLCSFCGEMIESFEQPKWMRRASSRGTAGNRSNTKTTEGRPITTTRAVAAAQAAAAGSGRAEGFYKNRDRN